MNKEESRIFFREEERFERTKAFITKIKNEKRAEAKDVELVKELVKENKPNKTSVKSKLKEGKEKVAKTPAKKTKEKEAQACV